MTTLTPLRNIYLSGGLFTENLLLKIRDKRHDIKEVQWNTFGENWQKERKDYYEVWDWAKRLFGEIADNLDSWTIEERFEKWIKPLLQKLEHKSEPKPIIDLTKLSEEEQDNILNRIQTTHQLKNHAKIGLHVCKDDNFDERNDTNYQKKSQHDHFQRYILLNEGIQWGLLCNGRHIRLLGEYSNIYAKGYIQFNLDSIFINKDESEFWVFYALIHISRFNEIYGLNPDDWIDKLKKKWKDLSKKLSSEDARFDINIIATDILTIYEKTLNEFIDKANDKGVLAIKATDSEVFMLKLKESGLDLGETGREFYLKELDSVISNINENISIIQRLQKRSQEEGIEAGKKLRENVKKSLELMGEGLIDSSKAFTNDILKTNVEIKDFYQELLRIAYRIIFVLYAESKDLLPGVATIYYNDLGLTYLRKKAQQPIRDDQNTDLWHRLLLLFQYLDTGEISLGINAFSGEIFDSERIPLISDENYNLSLPNSTILRIIRELTIVDLGIGLQPINYSRIGEDEIGSIYEALLDFQPRYIKKDSQIYHFILEEIDTERKGSGTYYTPKGLIDILLKTALKPIVDNKLSGLETKEKKLKAIQDLKVCDPACGGGSFLLASIDYLGKIYAQIETEEDFPEENILRQARRKILQNCIYGVDLNPMALELAKISLWLKVSVKDKPLTFLDNHLKLGNSLIGYTKKQKISKIPLKALNIVKGNNKTGIPDEKREFLNEAKEHLKNFSITKNLSTGKPSVQKTILPYKDSENYSNAAISIFNMEEESVNEYKEKKKCYSELLKSNSWKNLNLQANLWISSFFWNMSKKYVKQTPTDTLVLKAKQGVLKNENPTVGEVYRLCDNYHYFNWFLEFPEVFQKANPGFDCILMNPPWEVLTFKEMEFFSGKSEEVIKTQNKSQRQNQIKKLKDVNPKLHMEYINEYVKMKKESHYFRNSGFFRLSAKGSMNLFALFIERSRKLINKNGKIGGIVQSTILTGSNLQELFQDLIDSNSLESCFDFLNKYQIFPLHTYQQFSLITFSAPSENPHNILMSFFTWSIERLKKSIENYENGLDKDEFNREINEGGSIIPFSKEDFNLFNPNSKNSPVFKRIKDFELVKKAYERVPIIISKANNKIVDNHWNLVLKAFFHPANDSKFFKTKKQLKKLKAISIKPEYEGGEWSNDKGEIFQPLYGGSSIWYYDHRYNEIIPKLDMSKKRKADYIKVSEDKHKDPNYLHIPMYWINKNDTLNIYPDYWEKNWFIGYRDITSSNLKRSFVASPFPKYPSVNTLIIILFKKFRKEIICFLANISSSIFDYIARTKITGQHFPQYIVEQLPAFTPRIFQGAIFNEICSRVIRLIYTSWDMRDFALDFVDNKELEPFIWESEEREKLSAELDSIFFLMYGYKEEEIKYILDTFNILRDYELKSYGEYRTKKLILEAFNNFNSDPELGPLFRLEGVDFEKIKGE